MFFNEESCLESEPQEFFNSSNNDLGSFYEIDSELEQEFEEYLA